jgi:hypothetical protein
VTVLCLGLALVFDAGLPSFSIMVLRKAAAGVPTVVLNT